MNVVNGGSIQRKATTVTSVSAAQARPASSDAAQDPARQPAPTFRHAVSPRKSADCCVDYCRGRDALRADDLDRLDRHVVVHAATARLDLGHGVDHRHAVGDAAEHGIAGAAATRVEVGVVDQVDEELRGGAVRIVGARHRERAAPILDAVVGFVLDRRARRLLLHVLGHAAALHDEARDHAMEDGAVEMAGVDVVEEVLHRDGRVLRRRARS